jgi:hypothetical protein
MRLVQLNSILLTDMSSYLAPHVDTLCNLFLAPTAEALGLFQQVRDVAL